MPGFSWVLMQFCLDEITCSMYELQICSNRSRLLVVNNTRIFFNNYVAMYCCWYEIEAIFRFEMISCFESFKESVLSPFISFLIRLIWVMIWKTSCYSNRMICTLYSCGSLYCIMNIKTAQDLDRDVNKIVFSMIACSTKPITPSERLCLSL